MLTAMEKMLNGCHTQTQLPTHTFTQFDGDSLLNAWGKGLNTDATTHQQTWGRVHLPELSAIAAYLTHTPQRDRHEKTLLHN